MDKSVDRQELFEIEHRWRDACESMAAGGRLKMPSDPAVRIALERYEDDVRLLLSEVFRFRGPDMAPYESLVKDRQKAIDELERCRTNAIAAGYGRYLELAEDAEVMRRRIARWADLLNVGHDKVGIAIDKLINETERLRRENESLQKSMLSLRASESMLNESVKKAAEKIARLSKKDVR